jgi:hypothetical protein
MIFPKETNDEICVALKVKVMTCVFWLPIPMLNVIGLITITTPAGLVQVIV